MYEVLLYLEYTYFTTPVEGLSKSNSIFYIYQEVVAMTFGLGTVQSFLGFLQSIQADARVVTQLYHDCFLPLLVELFIHHPM